MKAIIFDLGGVLVNYDGRDTFLGVSELTAVPLETIYNHYLTIEHAFGTGQLSGRGYYDLLNQTFGLTASYKEFTQTFCRNQQRNEAAFEFSRDLQAREGIVVGIISNTNEVHANWLRANLPELEQFSSVILSNEVGLLKPDASIFELALSQLNVPASHALFVDDLAENVVGGTAVGLSGHCHVDWQITRPHIAEWLKNH